MAAGPRIEPERSTVTTKTRDLTPLQAVNEIRNNNGQVVLVLQGGGALGAYQCGVYQALQEAGVEPDWIIGTSIGAINAAIIAGNRVENRLPTLQKFWRRVESSGFWGAFPAWTGVADALFSWTTLTSGVPGFFETNIRAFLGAHVPPGADHAGYYSTEPLRRTLEELVDFSFINKGHTRLTVGAAHVRSSMMRYFDSKDMEIGPSHIMASGALPPAFPAVRIDGELYWDGGILSNTTEHIFDDHPRRNSLIFAVHLWHPTGDEPETIWQILNRQKDIHIRAGSQATSGASARRTSLGTSLATSSNSYPRRKRTIHSTRSWPDIAATRASMWCVC
jgi:NTE family protein